MRVLKIPGNENPADIGTKYLANAEMYHRLMSMLMFEYRQGMSKIGLDAMIGAPHPQVLRAMEVEHCESTDSQAAFTTGNYGIPTDSKTEWLFVTAPESASSLAVLHRQAWPAESAKHLPDREHCRHARPFAVYLEKARCVYWCVTPCYLVFLYFNT